MAAHLSQPRGRNVGEKSYCGLEYKAVSEQNINKKSPNLFMGKQAALHPHPCPSHLRVPRFLLSPLWSSQHAPTTTLSVRVGKKHKLIVENGMNNLLHHFASLLCPQVSLLCSLKTPPASVALGSCCSSQLKLHSLVEPCSPKLLHCIHEKRRTKC